MLDATLHTSDEIVIYAHCLDTFTLKHTNIPCCSRNRCGYSCGDSGSSNCTGVVVATEVAAAGTPTVELMVVAAM